MPKLRKIAVLMTDGEYNTEYLNADSTTQARSICANIKDTGIEVYTIDDSGKVAYIRTWFTPPEGVTLDPYFMEAHSA